MRRSLGSPLRPSGREALPALRRLPVHLLLLLLSTARSLFLRSTDDAPPGLDFTRVRTRFPSRKEKCVQAFSGADVYVPRHFTPKRKRVNQVGVSFLLYSLLLFSR